MVFKNFRYFFLILFILLQGLVIFVLFNKSIQIDGDLVTYLKIIGGDINIEYDIEPFSILIFKTIGVFPSYLHFLLLYIFTYILCIVECWIVFKNTKGSILWVIFFTIVIVPFFHAINLRTGFGLFFLFLFYDSFWGIILTPFFHTSLFPVLSGVKFKISIKSLIIAMLFCVLILIVLFTMISSKLENYYGYYEEGASVFGVLAEILFLIIFYFFIKKKYILKSQFQWDRVLILVLFISLISFRFAIISSRFITIAYLILLLIRLNSNKINKDKNFTLNNSLFYFLFLLLVFFRIYRIITMFGYLSI